MVLLEGLKKAGASEWHSWIYQSAREKKKARFDKLQNELFPVPGGGDKRDRTADLLNAIQALSQLSYTPRYFQ